MEVEELLMLIAMLSRFVALSSELMKLAERALAGEKVTKEQLDAAKAKMGDAIAGWDAAAKTLDTEPAQPEITHLDHP